MAAGFLRHLTGNAVNVRSAGPAPAEQINPLAVKAKAEAASTFTNQKPKIRTAQDSGSSNVVIAMDRGDVCPYLPGQTHLDWELDDPAGRGIDTVGKIRDDIRSRNVALIADLMPGD